ncbi:MAG: hypothetical protein KDA47_19735 [Planctomycetales bacterium]|nr:hypothetical protein [Planctomycetales bacterium]
MSLPIVDVLVLSRDEAPLHSRVAEGLRRQRGVELRVHRIVGRPRDGETHRWQTIARARNEAKQRVTARWAMFVDDDVVLAPDCVRQLLTSLRLRPEYGAAAANFKDEPTYGGSSVHVAMGATLFRREALDAVRFRCEANKCECRCCCDDLRRLGFGIAYFRGAGAEHLSDDERQRLRTAGSDKPSNDQRVTSKLGGQVVVAFNRRHYDKFRTQFLGTLRLWGNREPVTVVGYGLYPSEQSVLAAMPGVSVRNLPENGVMPPIRRLLDFQTVLAEMPGDTPVAYWDAGDVIFQTKLEPLWQLVRANPDKILAVREPSGYPGNAAIVGWTRTIRDPKCRQRAFELMSKNPFLNSGFAAGTARSMLAYFREAHRMRYGAELLGTADWGDQTALNLYCHAQPSRWHEIEQGWNYCLHDRQRGEVAIRPDGKMVSRRGHAIHVAHGNARSQRKLALIHEQLRSTVPRVARAATTS